MSHMEGSEQGEEFMMEPRHPWHLRTRILEGELVRQRTERSGGEEFAFSRHNQTQRARHSFLYLGHCKSLISS